MNNMHKPEYILRNNHKNASEMEPEMTQLLHHIKNRSNNSWTIANFDVACIALVVSVVVKEFMQIVH